MSSNKVFNYEEKSQDLEFEIIRTNGQKEKLRMNLNDDFHSKINVYCKKKRYK